MKRSGWILLVVAVGVCICVPFVIEMAISASNPGASVRFLKLDTNYYINIVDKIALFACAGTAWNLIGGYARQVSLGHGIFLGIGAYVSSILLMHWHVPFWFGSLVGAGIAVVIGYLMGMSVFRLKGHYFAISTIAFCMIFRILFENDRLKYYTGGGEGITLLGNQQVFNSPASMYYVALALLIGVLIVIHYVEKSRLGYYLVAIGQDEQAAMAVGINIRRTKQIVLAISAAFTACIGAIYAQYLGTFTPSAVFDVGISTQIAMFAIIGGLATRFGAVLGAVILVPIIALTEQFFGKGHDLIYGVLLIIMVLWKPRGLIGWLQPALSKASRKLSFGKEKVGT